MTATVLKKAKSTTALRCWRCARVIGQDVYIGPSGNVYCRKYSRPKEAK